MKENNHSFSSHKLSKFINNKRKLTNTESFASITSNFSTNEKEDISTLMNNIIKIIDDYQIQNEGKLRDEEISLVIKKKLFEINKKIYLIVDDNKNTFLHILTENSKFYALKVICDTYYILIEDENLFFKWFFYENIEKLNVLDIASIKANKKILSYLYSILSKTNISWLKLDDIENKKNTIFHYSAKKNKYYSILFWYEKLHSYFPNIKIFDKKNEHNLTPLHYACFDNNYECVRLLIDLGSNVNAVDINGKSILAYALNSNNLKIIELLIINGADPNIKDNEGKIPYDYSLDVCDKNIQLLINGESKYNLVHKNKNTFEIIHLLLILLFFNLLFLSRFIDVKNFHELLNDKFILLGIIFLGVSIISLIISLIFIGYFFCCIKHRQHLRRKKPNLLKLYEKYNFDICIKCLRRTRENSYHCAICSLCFDNWKFHSFWLNTCITTENYFKYKIFIISIFSLLLCNIFSETFFLLFPLFDKDEHKQVYLYNNFFYLYHDENKSEFQETNKKIKLYCFIPFMILLLFFYIIIMIVLFCKLFKSKIKSFSTNDNHNYNYLKLGLVYEEGEEIKNDEISSSVGASIDD